VDDDDEQRRLQAGEEASGREVEDGRDARINDTRV
jgi:hypothetical protein